MLTYVQIHDAGICGTGNAVSSGPILLRRIAETPSDNHALGQRTISVAHAQMGLATVRGGSTADGYVGKKRHSVFRRRRWEGTWEVGCAGMSCGLNTFDFAFLACQLFVWVSCIAFDTLILDTYGSVWFYSTGPADLLQ